MQDAYQGKSLVLKDDDLQQIMATYQIELNQKKVAAIKRIAEANQKAGETFLADNAKKSGVVSLPSGLQYKILTAGSGKQPGEEDLVCKCNY